MHSLGDQTPSSTQVLIWGKEFAELQKGLHPALRGPLLPGPLGLLDPETGDWVS